MQRASHDDFLCRVDLYASQLAINSRMEFDKSRPAKDRKEHPHRMPQTYSIWICNFRVPFCRSYREELGLFRLGSARRAGHRAGHRAGLKAGLLQGRRESAAMIASLQAGSAAKDAEIVRMKAEIAALKASAKLRGQVQTYTFEFK